MAIEIRVLSGARAGQVRRFEQSVVVVGRQAGLDFRFDPQQDLDVSGRHAEIRATDAGGYTIQDTNSTNGTFVNDQRITGPVTLRDGDKIRFGAKGPDAEVHLTVDADAMRIPAPSTEQRIAVAVSKQTAGMKRAMIAAGALLVVGIAGAAYYAKTQSSQRVEELRRLLADNEQLRITLAGTIPGDTALVNEMQRKLQDLQRRLPTAKSDAERAEIRAEIQKNQNELRRMMQMDLPTIFRQNSPGIAIIVTDIDGKPYSGSGFSISRDGMIVTNRHNVLIDGKSARRIFVKFTDTRDWLPADVVKVSDDPDADIALIKMSRPDTYPVVAGVSATATDASEGMGVAIIGYPLGYDLPMEGTGANDRTDFIAKASLNTGTVSKKTSSVLQIDSYATHGSSGSPVFSSRGHVVGLVYGGAREANGKIVYAVPPEKITEFIPAQYKAIVKD